jgi:hypothetical protein
VPFWRFASSWPWAASRKSSCAGSPQASPVNAILMWTFVLPSLWMTIRSSAWPTPV